MTILIRPAVRGDARAIGEVRVQGWRETYSHFLSAGLLDSLEPNEERWRDVIELGLGTFVVAEVEGEVAGFRGIRPARRG